MCTLSFMPVPGGFHLLMNRDEQRTRPVGLPPDLHSCGHHQALYPSEPTGGTWIGINERGLTLALINWYSKPQLAGIPASSRGTIIPELLSTDSAHDAENLLKNLPLNRFNPFRLIMVSTEEQSVHEFLSDSLVLLKNSHSWTRKHWFSSGFNEPETMRRRAEICSNSFPSIPNDPRGSLRALHQSHEPEKGPYSICMHRADAHTVSFTEIILQNGKASLTYHHAPPCKPVPPTTLTIRLIPKIHGSQPAP